MKGPDLTTANAKALTEATPLMKMLNPQFEMKILKPAKEPIISAKESTL